MANAVDPSGKSSSLANGLNGGMCQAQSQDCAGIKYVVQPGDTIFRLSLRFGVTAWEIAGANGITNINLLIPGMTLCIPGQSPISTPTPSPSPTPSPPAWNTPAFTSFPIDVSDPTSGAYQDLFGNGSDGLGARGCRLFAYGSDSYESTGYLHPGFDYYVPVGTEIRSVSNGIVVGVTVNGSPSATLVGNMAPEDVTFGRSTVIVRYGYSYVIFAHLGVISVGVGNSVSSGDVIGSVGQYTDGFGSHLHLEVRNFSQALTYDGIVASGIEPNTGIITPGATSAANPLLFVNPYQYFDANSQQLMNNCVQASQSSQRYPSDSQRPNGGQRVTPETQSTRCFDSVGNPVDFDQCNRGLWGAPQ